MSNILKNNGLLEKLQLVSYKNPTTLLFRQFLHSELRLFCEAGLVFLHDLKILLAFFLIDTYILRILRDSFGLVSDSG
jgi:hypothetical protein